MEALVFFIFPLFIYLVMKIAIWRDIDTTEIDLKKYAEGIKMMEFGFLVEAIKYFDKAIEQNPKSMVAYAKRADCHFMLKNYYQAIYNYNKAQSINHDLPEVFLNQGICYFKIQDYEMAYKEFNKAVWFYRNENAEAFKWRGKSLESLGRKEAAEKDFATAQTLLDSSMNDKKVSNFKKLKR